MASEKRGPNRWWWALAGAVIGLVAGYLFFHDDGDTLIAGWLAPVILAIAAATVGYLLAAGTSKGSRSG